jgi:cytochrome c oxidase subunit 2
MAANGQKLFQELGCASCHRSDTQGRGPNLVGVYGHPVMLDTGSTATADDNYIRESILNPGTRVVSGFKPIMPTFSGIVSEDQVLALIAYVKSLAQPQQVGPVSTVPTASNTAPAAGNEKVQ